jgi:DNA-binding IclR family transcriptional regulator
MNDDVGGVAAVDRALSILDALTDQKTSLAELAKRTGLYKSTILRLATSLERFGYVLRSEDGGYRLGSKLLYLGSLYQKHFNTSEVVPPILRKIADELHEGASFYIADGEHRVVLHRVDASRSVRDQVHEGDRFVLTNGASGHVLRAFNGARGERFDNIREAMYAASYGERDPETAAVSCPVFGHGNRAVGALSVSGPRYRIEALGEAKIVPVLFKHGHALTRTFGGDVHAPTFVGWLKPSRAKGRSSQSAAAPTRGAPASRKTSAVRAKVAASG